MTSAERRMFCGLLAVRRKENMWLDPHHNSQCFGKTPHCLVTALHITLHTPHHNLTAPLANKKCILHFTFSSFCAFRAYQFCHSVSLCFYSYFDFSHPQTAHADIITQKIHPFSFFRRYQSVYCNSNLTTSCMHILTLLNITRLARWESGCSGAIRAALVAGGLLHGKTAGKCNCCPVCKGCTNIYRIYWCVCTTYVVL